MILYSDLNPVQKCAYELIRNDAKNLYSMLFTSQINIPHIFMLSTPYVGAFVDGVSQWGNKVKIDIGNLTKEEKAFYQLTRNSFKIFENNFTENVQRVERIFYQQDSYFSSICKPIAQKLKLYNNISIYKVKNHIIGNTIQLNEYYPTTELGKIFNEDVTIENNMSKIIFEVSQIIGRLFAQYLQFDNHVELNDIQIEIHDLYLFRKKGLFRYNNFNSLTLLNLLSSINYIIYCIEQIYITETSTRLRFAYLVYYYVALILPDINANLSTEFIINTEFINQSFRNCLAHYGLGQIINSNDIVLNDELFGITIKFFSLNYTDFKKKIISELENLSIQFEHYLFL